MSPNIAKKSPTLFSDFWDRQELLSTEPDQKHQSSKCSSSMRLKQKWAGSGKRGKSRFLATSTKHRARIAFFQILDYVTKTVKLEQKKDNKSLLSHVKH